MPLQGNEFYGCIMTILLHVLFFLGEKKHKLIFTVSFELALIKYKPHLCTCFKLKSQNIFSKFKTYS